MKIEFPEESRKRAVASLRRYFAAEMDHFSDCVLNGRDPRTPGAEGLADVRVIEAIAEAARSGKAVAVKR